MLITLCVFFKTKSSKMLIFKKFQRIFQFLSNIFSKRNYIFFLTCYAVKAWAIGLPFKFSFTRFSSKLKESGQIPVVKMSKKGDFENQKVTNCNCSTKSVPVVRFFQKCSRLGTKKNTNRGIPVHWLIPSVFD